MGEGLWKAQEWFAKSSVWITRQWEGAGAAVCQCEDGGSREMFVMSSQVCDSSPLEAQL